MQLHLHKSNMNWDEFYTKYIPKTSLPSNYGGTCPSIEELNDSFRTELIAQREYFLWEERQRSTDTNGNIVEQETTPAFKKLDID